ncbi:MAG: hypothetical protein ABSH38_18800 [Verrucomicrobiota bacterium]|jgi:hypothetical protein
MKPKIKLGLLLLLALSALTVQGQYSINWWTIGGGGGACTSGVYSVSGTIGRHDAGGPLTGGNYSLTSGFWSLIAAVQTPGAPSLAVQLIDPTTVKISWPSASAGWGLQQNSDLSTTNWSNSSITVSDDGTTRSVIISPPKGSLFFRLAKLGPSA